MEEKYAADKNWKDAHDLYKMCQTYALAYTEVMLARAKAEEPDIFAIKGMDKGEMQMHLVHNMCLPQAKLNAKLFRERTAALNEEMYLKDDIRRLVNQGDKFHPYL